MVCRIPRSSYTYKRTKCESPAGPRDGRVQDIRTPGEDGLRLGEKGLGSKTAVAKVSTKSRKDNSISDWRAVLINCFPAEFS